MRRHRLALAVFAAATACHPIDAALAQDEWRTDFTRVAVDPTEIVSGGPPKDGIPAIDEPRFVSIRSMGRFIDDNEPVAVVRRNGETKVYPLQILIWHEIVNDVVGGDPVTVTYCPLCNTTLAFDRRFQDMLLDFGTTGRLRHSDLIMYDRQTETWWQQATGQGIVGTHAGAQLRFVPSSVMRWQDVKEQLPDALVLSRDTGHDGYLDRYGINPYRGYDRRGGPFEWTFQGQADDGLQPMERVVALHVHGESWAVPFSTLRERRVAALEIGGKGLVVFFTPETGSAVDAHRMMDSRAVGSSAVYVSAIEGRALTFARTEDDGVFRDAETGTLWSVFGTGLEGALAGRQLEEFPHGNHFWFAWAVFRPQTHIWGR
jgi:hypothetical protein